MTQNTKIYHKWQGYSFADCDCKYCQYYGGRRGKKKICLVDECVCKAEIEEAHRRERRINGSKN